MEIHKIEGMDPTLALDMIAQTGQKAMNEVIGRGDSDIQRFYSGATVFLTGSSGFLGKQLIEKLLRSCNIKKMFLLMRDKKGKTKQQRCDEMLEDPVYDHLRKTQPDFAKKLVLVEGDAAELQLGISSHDWSTIVQEVDVIFHAAATTRFDESLRLATLTNVRGTREALNLAKDCKKLRAFVHVSTAYCNGTIDKVGSDILEQFYPSPIPPDAMIKMAESMDETRLCAITPKLIDGWPNTYTFTKAISEELIRTSSGDFLISIVRPPVVISTAYEPVPGWMDMSCIYGATGIILGGVLGLLHVLYVRSAVKICFMPVDYVNNVIIAAGWDAVMRRNEGDKDNIKIYSISNPNSDLKFSIISDTMNSRSLNKFATPKSLWYCYVIETENKMLHWVLFWLLHYIPAYIVDGVMFLFRVKKPQGLKSFVKVYTKIYKLSSVLSYFLTKDWNFLDENVRGLYSKMSKEDKAIYNFDVKKIDWTLMVYIWAMGLRRFIIKDGLKDTEYGCKKQNIFKLLNYIFAGIYLYVFYRILCLFYSFILGLY